MVVLGCGMEDLQKDRIETAIKYVNTVDSPVTWFLTGGVKNALKTAEITEASKMEKQIKNNNQHRIVLDEMATNTAENFAYLKKWIMETYGIQMNKPEIIITTSEFHKERAEKIFNGIFGDNTVKIKWNLSRNACASCWNDEKIHMVNVEKDVEKAKNKINRAY